MALLHLCYCQWCSCCLVLIEIYNKCRGEEWLITFTIQWNDHRLSGDHFTWWHHHHSTPKPPEKVTFTRFLPHSHSLTALIYNFYFLCSCATVSFHSVQVPEHLVKITPEFFTGKATGKNGCWPVLTVVSRCLSHQSHIPNSLLHVLLVVIIH